MTPRRRPTIADVARRAGVSAGAVSFALNGRPGVGEATRVRILRAARELDWQPSHRARSLSRSRAFAVGLVLARSAELLGADPFFPAFIAGLETVLGPAEVSLLLHVVDGPDAEAAVYRRLAAEGRVDGVVLTDLRAGDERIALLAELALPAVTLGRPDVDSALPAVCLDDASGVSELVRALLERGHRRIAHVAGPPPFLHSASRQRAWRDALADAGLPAGPLVVADFTAAGGAAATERLLDLAEAPTAIVYANDVMALAGLSVARRRGIDVPGQLSLAGHDDTELARHVHPPLTSVASEPQRWGAQAAQSLLALIDGRSPGDIELSPARLVLRESVADAPVLLAQPSDSRNQARTSRTSRGNEEKR